MLSNVIAPAAALKGNRSGAERHSGACGSVPDPGRQAAPIQKRAALRTLPRRLPGPDAMPRRYRTPAPKFFPGQRFVAAHDQHVQGVGEGRSWRLIRAGVERAGLELPLVQSGTGGDRHFQFGNRVVEFPTIQTMNGLHGQMRAAIAAAGYRRAIAAFDAFKQIGSSHVACTSNSRTPKEREPAPPS